VVNPQQIVENSFGLLADVALAGQLVEQMLLMACEEEPLLRDHASRGRAWQLFTLERLLAMRARGDTWVTLSALRRAVHLPKNTVHAQLRDAIERRWVRCGDGCYALTEQGAKIARAVAKAMLRAEEQLAPMITKKCEQQLAELGRAFLAAPDSAFSRGFRSPEWWRFRDANTRRIRQ